MSCCLPVLRFCNSPFFLYQFQKYPAFLEKGKGFGGGPPKSSPLIFFYGKFVTGDAVMWFSRFDPDAWEFGVVD